MFKKIFGSVMDPDRNGLNQIQKVARFQIMVTLSVMWSIIFCISAGIFVWLPGYVLIHVVLLLLGIFGTGWIFRSSQSPPGGR